MWNRRTLAVLLSVLWPVAFLTYCGDDDDGGGPSSDAGDIQTDQVDQGGEEPGPVLDLELIGVYEIVSFVLAEGTITTSFQSAPTTEFPQRELRVTGGLAVREDGTYLRLVKVIARNNPTADPYFVNANEDQLAHGTWSTEEGTLTATDEGEDPDEFTYSYNDTTHLLSMVAVDPEQGEPHSPTWRKVTVDTQVTGSYSLASMELANGQVITEEGVEIGGHDYRVQGSLTIAADGTYQRTQQFFVDENEEDSDDTEGIWFTEGAQMVAEEPGINTLLWSYTYVPATGILTLDAVDPDDPIQQMVYERLEE